MNAKFGAASYSIIRTGNIYQGFWQGRRGIIAWTVPASSGWVHNWQL